MKVGDFDINDFTKQFTKKQGSFQRLMGQLDKFIEGIPQEQKDQMSDMLDLAGQLRRRMSEASVSGDCVEILKLQLEAVEIMTKHGTATTNTKS